MALLPLLRSILEYASAGWRLLSAVLRRAGKWIAAVILGLVILVLGASEVIVRQMPGHETIFDEAEGVVYPQASISLIRDERQEGRRFVVLNESWAYIDITSHDGAPFGTIIIVAEKFKSDFASIPNFAHWFVNPFGVHAEAAIVHDWLYAQAEPGKRKQADEIFYRAMARQNVDWLRRRIMFLAVRLGGGGAYARDDWDTSFYELSVQTTLPPDCILEKDYPLSALETYEEKTDDADGLEMIGHRIFHLYDVLQIANGGPKTKQAHNEAWRDVLSQDACKTVLSAVALENYKSSPVYRFYEGEFPAIGPFTAEEQLRQLQMIWALDTLTPASQSAHFNASDMIATHIRDHMLPAWEKRMQDKYGDALN